MICIVLSFILTSLVAVHMLIRSLTKRMREHADKIPGPRPLPIIGSALDFNLKTEDYFEFLNDLAKKYQPLVRVWMGPMLFIGLSDPRHVEAVMNSSKHIVKSVIYNSLLPWLGTGLLTSHGIKWKRHRKMLTPTFHFSILEQFVDVFNSNGNILVERLSKLVDGPVFDVCPYVTMCTLDVICESTMGVNINAQRGNSLDYVEAIRRIADIAVYRALRPWNLSERLFRWNPLHKYQTKNLSVLHGMTNSVIRTRRQELLQRRMQGTDGDTEDEYGRKRKLAFLDLLMSSQDGGGLTDEDLREEVDTFMFEGHDTTSSGVSFTLWVLANDQQVQDKVAKEIVDVLGDSDNDATLSDLQEMKYLEQVIKEALRLYPSVPLLGRKIYEDIVLDDYVIPAGCNVLLMPFSVHRIEGHFPDPEKFDPERFSQENCLGRHPYSYIPFAAGPRNCIGQKFAMLELKSIVYKIVRKFVILPGDPNEKLKLIAELVLKSKSGINIKLKPRSK